jgi:hypothetical protein
MAGCAETGLIAVHLYSNGLQALQQVKVTAHQYLMGTHEHQQSALKVTATDEQVL